VYIQLRVICVVGANCLFLVQIAIFRANIFRPLSKMPSRMLMGIDDAQYFLGYVLSTEFFLRIRFSSASRAYPSQEGLW